MLKEKPKRKLKGSDLAQRLYEEAFNIPRTPRSEAYKNGVRAELDFRFCGLDYYGVSYKMGTAEYDAFFAGTDEGRLIWRNHIDSLKKEA